MSNARVSGNLVSGKGGRLHKPIAEVNKNELDFSQGSNRLARRIAKSKRGKK